MNGATCNSLSVRRRRRGVVLQIAVLGPLDVNRADGSRVPVRSRHQRLLLALLAFRVGRVVPADELIEALWPDRLPADPPAALQSHVHRLRRLVGAVVATDPAGYCLDVPPAAVDAVRFEELVDLSSTRGDDRRAAIADLDAAVGLWRGHAYADVIDCDRLAVEAQRLEDLRARALEDRAALLLAAGRVVESAAAAAALAAEEPYRERAIAVQMRALASEGRHVDALRTYQAFRRRLADDLGVEPSRELRALEGEILRHEDVLPSAIGLPGNSFVGRERELAELAGLLESARLVTLTGAGGVGKTRLAIHAAARSRERHPDGVHLCELAGLTDPDAVAGALASTLQVYSRGDDGLLLRLAAFLEAKRVLLVVDNCEHVLAGVSELVRVLLAHAPEIRVLATSRQRLGVEGERVVVVRPLPVGTDEELDPAVALFADRTAAAGADRPLADADLLAARTLCRQLEGLPLAIELAAARCVSRRPGELVEEIAGRLDRLADDRRAVDRHRSIEATIRWSYELLSPAEQDVFRQASVFAGGFTSPALAHVMQVPSANVTAASSSLVEQSLMRFTMTSGATRYSMLEPVRQFAHACLEWTGRLAATRAAHAAWAAEWLFGADAGLRGPDEASWAAEIGRELDNLRAAHRWCLDHDQVRAQDLAGALYWYAYFYGPAELFSWADETVVRDDRVAGRSPALATAALGAWRRADLTRARSLAEAAIELADDPIDARFAWEALRSTEHVDGNYTRALVCRDHAMALARRAGDLAHVAHDRVVGALALGYLGRLDAADGELAAAREVLDEHWTPTVQAFHDYVAGEILVDRAPADALPLLERGRDLARSIGNRFVAGIAGASAVSCAARLGDPERAIGEYADLIDYFHRADAWPQLWTTMRTLIETLTRLGRDEPAAALHGALTASAVGPDLRGPDAVRMREIVDALRTRLGDERFGRFHEEGAALGDDRAVAFALQVTGRAMEL